MNEERLEKVLGFYYENAQLKGVERQGWIDWNVKGKRETIPEHTWGTQILAFAIWSEFNLDIDITKVIFMLKFHETEEIKIGDNTPFGNMTPEEKLRKGHEAVKQICAKLRKGQMIIDLINEFDARETPEAKFAYYCDKMECDLMAKFYSQKNRFSLEDMPENVAKNNEVKQIMQGYTGNVLDLWLKFDEPKYKDSKIFLEMLNFLKEYQIKD